MAARRGTIRTELRVDGAEAGRREFSRFRSGAQAELSGVARAFSGIQGSVRAFNQYRETINAVANAVSNFAARARELLSLNRSTAAGFANLDSAATDVGRAFADSVNRGDEFRDVLREVARDIRGLEDDARSAGAAIRAMITLWNDARPHDEGTTGAGLVAGGGLVAAVGAYVQNRVNAEERAAANAEEAAAEARHQQMMNRLGGTGRGMLDPEDARERAEDTRDFLAEIDQGFERAAADAEWAARATAAYRENLRAAATEEQRRQEQQARSGAGDAERIAEMTNLKMKLDLERQISEERQQQADRDERDQWARNERFASEERANQRRIDALERVIQHTRELQELERERANKQKELLTQQMEIEQALIEYRKQKINEAQDKVEGYGDAILTVGGAVADVFGQLSAEQAEGSKAAEKYKKIQGGILAGISFVRAAIEIAAAISAGATQNYVGMAGHIASSVAYIAAGAMALRNLGGNSSRPTASTGFTASEKKSEAKQAAPGGTTIITLGATDGRLARELQRSANSAARSGLDRSQAGAGRYY